MKTTNEGFLVNTLRRLPRHGVKALAAGAVLIAAALPLAVASVAGATNTTDITGAYASFTTTPTGGLGSQTGSIGVGNSFGTGATGTLTLYVGSASDIANNGSTPTLTTNAPGVTFTSVSEGTAPSSQTVTANFASTTATVAGSYSLTLTDGGGSSTLAPAFTVNPPPSETSFTGGTPSLADGAQITPYTEVINGSGFEVANTMGGNGKPTVVFTSQVDGTQLETYDTAASTSSQYENATISQPASPTGYQGTQLTVGVYSLNKVTGHPAATVGAYTMTIINGDGGTVSVPNALYVTGNTITNLSPSAFPLSAVGPTLSVSVLGSGFQQGAQVSFTYDSGAGTCTGLGGAIGTVLTTYNSPTSLTATFVEGNSSAVLCNAVVTNPAPAAGNGAIATLTGALGFATASTVAPTITATSVTTPIVPGSASGSITLTGTGFSYLDTYTLVTDGNGVSPANGVTLSAPAGNSGTSISYTLSVASNNVGGPTLATIAGPDALQIGGSSGTKSVPFPAAITIAGPAIVSQSPVDVPIGAPAGTVITLTGTGFTPTLSGAVVHGSGAGPNGAFTGNVNYVNATTVDVVITTSPTTNDATDSTPAYVYLSETLIGGTGAADSASYPFVFGLSPTVSGIVYKAGTTGIGAGAVAQTATITGTNFKTGVVVGSFKNVNSVADAGVTAKVISINTAGTAITVSFAIAATDTNTLDSFSVTNTDGGTAASPQSLIIQPAPTVTAVAPATASANTTDAFTITGTNFGAGATVTATADGTCGAATVVSATSITVTCTFGASTATAAALLVTNANGGVATSAAVVPATSAPVAPAPHATGEAGSAIIGRTVNIAVAGVGFYGQPSVTSTGNSVKAVVSHDNGTLLTVVVTVGKTTGPGEHTLTFTLANGDVFKANYAIIK